MAHTLLHYPSRNDINYFVFGRVLAPLWGDGREDFTDFYGYNLPRQTMLISSTTLALSYQSYLNIH